MVERVAKEWKILFSTFSLLLITACVGKKTGSGEAPSEGGGGSTSQTSSWFFNSTNYTFDFSKVEVTGGVARLKPLDQTDDENGVMGFGGGTHTNTQWDSGNNWLELTDPSTQPSGAFSSRIFNGTTSQVWDSLTWTPSQPYLKELPNNAATESAYLSGNVTMTSNVLLFHMNESSWDGTSGEVTDSSGQLNTGTGLGSVDTDAWGKFNRAGIFDGIDDGILVSHSADFDFGAEMAAEFWFKPGAIFDTSSDGDQGLLDKGVFSFVLDSTTGRLQFAVSDNTTPTWTNSYNGAQEEIFELAPFNGLLYAGQGRSSGDGDVLVCDPTISGSANLCESGDWAISYNGTQESIESLATFNGRLYFGQGIGNGDGDIYICNPANAGSLDRCDNAADWTLSRNGATDIVRSMIVFNDTLYAGFGNDAGEGDIYLCNPTTTGNASTCESGDWSLSYNGTLNDVHAFTVFNGKLYAGIGATTAGSGDILMCDPVVSGNANRCESGDWSVVFNGTQEAIYALAVYQGRLYAGQGYSTGDGDILMCNPVNGGSLDTCDSAADWTTARNGAQETIQSFAVYGGRLYGGQGLSNGDGDVLVCNPSVAGNLDECDNASDWTVSSNSSQDRVEGFATYRGILYAAKGDDTGEGDIERFGNMTVVESTTSSWDQNSWYHIAGIYDGTNLNLYVNGSLEGTLPSSITFGTNTLPLLIGKSYGSRKSHTGAQVFSGLIDELALYNQDLDLTSVQSRYRRGALSLRFQVRSCDDAVCDTEIFMGPDGTASSYYSELGNSTLGLPNLTLTNVPNNRYFQYRAYLDTSNPALTPTFSSVSVGPIHYDASRPEVINTVPTSFTSLIEMNETLGAGNQGSVTYQISNDGSSWYYHDGSGWVPASGGIQTNTAADLSNNLITFNTEVGAGDFYFKAFLNSDGSQACELDQVEVQKN